ncbi:MAG TPA: MFS transporter [Gemmatimonadales bacterium]|jgi:MFS family permease|nr:MFS transporter [Gemmatimonadales bacterium]
MTQPEQPTALPPYRPTAFGSLKHRNFRLFIIGQFVSLCGTWIQNVAQGWLVYQLSSSAFKVGLVSSLGSLPVLGFTLYGGALADRVNKHRWILLLQSLMLIPVLGLAVMVQLNRVTVTWVAVAALVLGVLNAFEVPARQAFVVDMAGREDLMNAIALNSSIFNLSRIIGPTIAGILITTAGIALCFYANAVSFLAVVIGLLLMRMPPEPRRAPTERTGRLWDGLQYVTSEPWAKALVIITGTLSVFGFAFLAMLPVFATEALKTGAAGYGGMVSAVGIGAFSAAIFVAAFGHRLRRRQTILVAGVAFGACLIGASLSRSYLLALVLFTLAGTAMVLNNVLTNTLLQTSAPDHLRGRVMGVYSFLILGLSPFGSLQAGFVAEQVGVRAAIGGGGAICLLVTAVVAWRMSRPPRQRGEASSGDSLA